MPFFHLLMALKNLVQSGVSAVIQPAGSIRDKEIINLLMQQILF